MISGGIIALCLIGAILQGIFIYSEFKKKWLAAVFLKGSASIIFVIVGICEYIAVGGSAFSRLVMFGLMLGAIGDILLNIRYLAGNRNQFFFVVGTLSFFTGHILYLAALISIADRMIYALTAAGVITAVIIVTMAFKVITSFPMKCLGALYVCAVVLMACVAVVNALSVHDTGRILYAVGASLFLISDLILIFNTFGKNPQMKWSAVCLSLYYPGQILIALALGFIRFG